LGLSSTAASDNPAMPQKEMGTANPSFSLWKVRATVCETVGLEKSRSSFPLSAPRSEKELKTKLEHAGSKGSSRLAELRTSQIPIGIVEVHAIEEIKGFRAKLEIKPLV